MIDTPMTSTRSAADAVLASDTDRRRFIQSLSAGLAAGAALGGFHQTTALGQGTAAGGPSRKLGWALVGLGGLATNQIAPAFKQTEHCELKAVVTGTREKAKEWAEQYDIGDDHLYDYDSFDKIAGDDTVDVVYIVLPNSMHCDFTKRAAAAGKHVYCEKPMANTAAECREMIAACEQQQRQLGIAYRCQFDPLHEKCMQFVRDKTFGDLKLIEAGFGFRIGNPDQWRLKADLAGGGALMDVGVYALQACRYLSGEEPIEIIAQEVKTDPVKFAEVDETIAWSMKFPSGAIASCNTSYGVSGVNKFRCYCTEGHFGLDPAYSYSGNRGSSSRGELVAEPTNHFAVQMDRFAQCILEGAPNRVSGQDGLNDLLAIEAIYQSIRSGQAVTL